MTPLEVQKQWPGFSVKCNRCESSEVILEIEECRTVEDLEKIECVSLHCNGCGFTIPIAESPQPYDHW